MFDLDIHIGATNFNVRAAILIVRDNKLLLNRFEDASFWFTPGGRIQSGESSYEAAKREFFEEVGVEIEELRLVLVAEIFAKILDKNIHNIEFFYIAEDIDMISDGSFPNLSDAGVSFEWLSIERLKDLDLRPTFLNQLLPSLLYSTEVQHLAYHSK